MDLILRFCIPLPADFIGALPDSERFVIVTFDDGFESVAENAIPVLNHRNIPYTLFIISGLFDSYPDWIKENNHPDRFEKTMTVDRLHSIGNRLLSVGSHSMTHPCLTEISKEEAQNELYQSKKQLEQITNRDVTLFAIPHGEYTAELLALAQSAGYKRVFSINPECVFSQLNEFLIGRFDVSPSDWKLEFLLKILGSYRWLPYAYKLKKQFYSPWKKFELL